MSSALRRSGPAPTPRRKSRLRRVRACTHRSSCPIDAFKHAPYGKIDGTMTKRPMSDARISGMVAAVALLVMFAIVGLFVWMGS